MVQMEINPQLTGLSLAYTNKNFIADKICRRIPVDTRTFGYRKYLKDLNLQLPETLVGDSSDPNKVEFKSELKYATVRGDSLTDDIPQVEIDDAKGNKENLMQDSTEFLTDVFLACREARLAKKLGTVENYGGNSKTLTAKEKFNTAEADALNMIHDCIDKMWFPANTMIMSRQAYSALRRNPSIISAVNRNSSQKGVARLEDIKDLFDVDNIYIGMAQSNSAKRGRQANFVNLWGNDIILAYINPAATFKKGLTFMATGEFGKREITTGYDGKAGVRGVQYVKIAEQLEDVILAPDCGYLLKGVI